MRRNLLLVALSVVAFALPASARADSHMDEGFAAVEDKDYARALDEFRVAGESGNVQGARIAGFMLLVGEYLYGPAVKAGPPTSDRAASESGRGRMRGFRGRAAQARRGRRAGVSDHCRREVA